ncbi:hypothetical protein P3X46_034616, partial [Hevea brasiliensis]
MAEKTGPKWEGKTSVELKGATADQVWPFFEDFCNIHQWFPILETRASPAIALQAKTILRRTCGNIINHKEKLIMINPVERCLSYEVIENNMGFNPYTATFKVLPVNGDGAGDQKG